MLPFVSFEDQVIEACGAFDDPEDYDSAAEWPAEWDIEIWQLGIGRDRYEWTCDEPEEPEESDEPEETDDEKQRRLAETWEPWPTYEPSEADWQDYGLWADRNEAQYGEINASFTYPVLARVTDDELPPSHGWD